ncbi:MAG: hypothetical protein J7501_03090 [Bdellovibrio sp.]|nr:hypothetical protein [Bdellovibrio sp.]
MRKLLLILTGASSLMLAFPLAAKAGNPSYFRVCSVEEDGVMGANYQNGKITEKIEIWDDRSKGVKKKILAAAEQTGICPTATRRPTIKTEFDLCLPDKTWAPGLFSDNYHWAVNGVKFVLKADRTLKREVTELYSHQYMEFWESSAKKKYIEGLKPLINAGVCPAVSLDVVD